MPDKTENSKWPSPEEYGERFAAIDARLQRSLASMEYRAGSATELAELRYRLAKLAIAAEDLRQAIRILEDDSQSDDVVASALVELRNACDEVRDSFAETDSRIVKLLNFVA